MEANKGVLFEDGVHTIFDLGNGTYRIDEEGIANCYLLIGENKALLIDSGDGVGDIGSTVASLTNKPVSLLLTHNHCDHSGGRYYFTEYFVESDDRKLIYRILSSRLASKSIAKEHKELVPTPKLCKKRHHFPHQIGIGSDFTINLGNRLVRTHKVGGHTRGSIIILDERTKTMFAGDNICPWLWLQLPGCESLSKWLTATKTILSYAKTYKAYSGHGDGLTSYEAIEGLIKYCEKILSEAKYGKFDHEKKTIEIDEDPNKIYRLIIKKSGLK